MIIRRAFLRRMASVAMAGMLGLDLTFRVPKMEARRVFDVTSYGAGQGGDDTAAIQAAIDAAGPNGTVVFPRGNYTIGPPIFVGSNVTLKGER